MCDLPSCLPSSKAFIGSNSSPQLSHQSAYNNVSFCAKRHGFGTESRSLELFCGRAILNRIHKRHAASSSPGISDAFGYFSSLVHFTPTRLERTTPRYLFTSEMELLSFLFFPIFTFCIFRKQHGSSLGFTGLAFIAAVAKSRKPRVHFTPLRQNPAVTLHCPSPAGLLVCALHKLAALSFGLVFGEHGTSLSPFPEVTRPEVRLGRAGAVRTRAVHKPERVESLEL